MAGHQMGLDIDADFVIGINDHSLLADPMVRNTVVMTVFFYKHMTVFLNGGFPAFFHLKGQLRQRRQAGAFLAFKQLPPAVIPALEQALVVIVQVGMDGFIELVEAIKTLVAQGGINLAVGVFDHILGQSFVLGPGCPRGDNDRPVMISKVFQRLIDPGFVTVCFDHSAFEVIRNNPLGHTAEKSQGSPQGCQQIGYLLAGDRFYITVLAKAQCGNQYLGLDHLCRLLVNIFQGSACKVDVQQITHLMINHCTTRSLLGLLL